MTVRLLGLRLQRQGGVETTAGEALRYLAELPFAPIAILHNRELEWRELDDGAVEVAAVIHGERLAVEFEFDGAGNVVRASSRTRKLKRDGVWQTIPWGGEFRNYKPLDGLWIPTSGEVYWDIPEGRYTYWRGEIVHAEMLDQAFRSR